MKLHFTVSFLISFRCIQVDSSERDVLGSIFEGYQKDTRPVYDDRTPINVTVRPRITTLLEVNAEQEYVRLAMYIDQELRRGCDIFTCNHKKSYILTMGAFKIMQNPAKSQSTPFIQYWYDEFLTWDPSYFNGTDAIKVPASKVWLPDIAVISSSLEPEYFMPLEDRIVYIYSDGAMYLSYPFVLTNYCKMEIRDYPFDTQECVIIIASWSYSNEELDLQHGSPYDNRSDLKQNKNTVWEIFPYNFEIHDTVVGEGYTYRQLFYRQKIKRKAAYYVWVLIAPTFIINALSLAGLYAPSNSLGEREEKVTLGLTTLLTLAVILTMVTGEMPRGSDLPILGRFVLIEITLIVISMAITVAIMFLHQRVTTRSWPVPRWMNWICHLKRKNKTADEQQIITDKTLRDSWQLDLPPNSNNQPISYQAIILRACFRQLSETHGRVSGWMHEHEKAGIIKHQWLLIFDRIDLIMFVCFQFIHLIAFILTFYPYISI